MIQVEIIPYVATAQERAEDFLVHGQQMAERITLDNQEHYGQHPELAGELVAFQPVSAMLGVGLLGAAVVELGTIPASLAFTAERKQQYIGELNAHIALWDNLVNGNQ